jgi:hypothetical protein
MYFLDFQCFFASFGFFNFYQNMGQKLGSNNYLNRSTNSKEKT